MARVKKNKTIEVQKFGGTEALGAVKEVGNMDAFKGDLSTDKTTGVHDVSWDANSVEAQSNTNLELDKGEGNAVVIRSFTFAFKVDKPEEILERRPTKQDLFNSHVQGIERYLWKDGLQFYLEVPPRITLDAEKMQYTIFVAARPMRGWNLNDAPKTLSELAHG